MTSAGRHVKPSGMFAPCHGSNAMIEAGLLSGTSYIIYEHNAGMETPAVVNGIQIVVTPLLTSGGRVVVMAELDR